MFVLGSFSHSGVSSGPGGSLSNPVAIDEGGTNATTYTTSQVLYYNGTRFVSAPWEINGSGHLLATTDNTNDIGTSSGNRPRNIYTSGVLVGGTSVKFTGNGRARMSSPSDGNLTMEDASGTGAFTMLAWGGITSGHVGLKRSSAVLQCRLGDDSAFATFTSGYLNATPAWSGTGTATTPLLVNVTADPGPADATSKFLDCQMGGSSRFYVRKDGYIAPAHIISGGELQVNSGNLNDLRDFACRQSYCNKILIGVGITGDIALERDAADTLALRRTTNAQSIGVYNTYTSSTSYERGVIDWKGSANVFRIGTEKGSGGGSARDMSLITNGVTRATFGSGGDFSLFTDLRYDSARFAITSVGNLFGSAKGVYWSSTFDWYGTLDSGLERAGASIVRVTNASTGPGKFAIDNVQGSNYERLKLEWATNVARMGTEKAGSGTARDFAIITDDTVRVTYGASGNQTMAEGHNMIFGTSTGSKIGTATNEKIGFWNATPVVQQVLATGAGASVDNVISLLQTLGLCKQS